MAKALPADGLVVTLEKDPKHHAWAAKTFEASPEGRKVVSLYGDAHDLMAEIEARGPYDLAFVDADKSGYADYLGWCEKNVRRGGLIVGDNTFLWGALWNQPEHEIPNVEVAGPRRRRIFHRFRTFACGMVASTDFGISAMPVPAATQAMMA
jgi:predicted O-methyltransferase YrrM